MAIKVLPKKDEAIEKEIEIMKGLVHSATVSYYGTCKTDDNFWVFIKFLFKLFGIGYLDHGRYRYIIHYKYFF